MSGRRVKGYVVAVEAGETENLKPILSVSTSLRLFDPRQLETVRWVATHYVAPMATVLARTAPPNLPKPVPDVQYRPVQARPGGFDEVASAAISGTRRPGTYLLGREADRDALVGLALSVSSAGKSVLIAVPTAAEVELVGGLIRAIAPDRVIEVSGDQSDAVITTRWSYAATRPGSIVVGTERVALWPIADLALVIVVAEGRRSHKARQTPTVHTRDVLRARGRVEGLAVVMTGAVPTTEALRAGMQVSKTSNRRLWSAVEVVDRTEEPPGGGMVTGRVRTAIRATVNRGDAVFVLVGRKGYAPAFRCVACKALRRCEGCGAATNQAGACQRCGRDLGPCQGCGRRRFEPLGAGVGRMMDELGRVHDSVGRAADGHTITVGTERDLVGLPDVALGVVVDADGLIFGSNYRSQEDALRLFGRLGGKVSDRQGARLILQTSQPGHPIFGALRRADPIAFLEHELVERSELGYPPFGELIVLEVTNAPSWAAERLRSRIPGMVLGPVETNGRSRWLLQGDDLSQARQNLRGIVGEMRDAGATVRVDVDPIDL